MDTTILTGIVSAVVSIIALVISICTYSISRREKVYADLDALYMETLKLGIENPRFRNPVYTKHYKEKFQDEDDLHRYETYAYIVWNICETIYDRRDETIFKTWRPVIVAENKLHRRWFDDPENHHKFKKRFRTYVTDNFPLE